MSGVELWHTEARNLLGVGMNRHIAHLGRLRFAALGLLAFCFPAGSDARGVPQAAPPNDHFANRTILPGTNAFTVGGSSAFSTGEAGEPRHAGQAPSRSIWFSWTAPDRGWVTLSTQGSSFDTVVGVYTGTAVTALTEVSSGDDAPGGLWSVVTFQAVPGTAYNIAISGFAGSSGGVTLTLTNTVVVVAYSTNFDAGLAGWTLDPALAGVAWAADMTPAAFPSGVSRGGLSLNFNNGVDYAGCPVGGALSPAISLAGVANPVLEFWCNYATETRGPLFDQRRLQVWNAAATARLAEWPLASVGYPFNPAGGIVGIGPGPCSEAYIDLESGAPVTAWHKHRVFLDPAWGTIRLRYFFHALDNLRNGYAGWAVDDLVVMSHPVPAPAGWPDTSPDTLTSDGDGNELDTCRRQGSFLRWSWGANNLGDVGVHLIIGQHTQAVLDRSYMFYDSVHGHLHMSQYSDFSLWRDFPGVGLRKVARGPKRSFCLTDVDRVLVGPPSISPGCNSSFQAISYGWQDVYGLGTSGQEINLGALPAGVDYWLVGVIDPLNRIRETSEFNQTDQIHFTMPSTSIQVAILDRNNPYPPTPVALGITSTAAGMFQGVPAVQVLGTGFDTTLTPVLYGPAATDIAEAPLYTLVSATEIWVEIPPGFPAPASIDLLRASGHATSARVGGPPPGPCGLAVTPTTALATSGAVGGVFDPSSRSYQIVNTGSMPLDWEAMNAQPWVAAMPSSGTLPPGESVGVTVSIVPAAAAALAAGDHTDTVMFRNLTGGTVDATRMVNLTAVTPLLGGGGGRHGCGLTGLEGLALATLLGALARRRKTGTGSPPLGVQ